MRRQFEQPTLPQPKLLEIYNRLEMKLNSLWSAIAAGVRPHDATGRFAEVYSLMEALPFTTDEFAVAKNRLRNTVAYLHCGERKASLFELGMLRQAVCENC